MACSAISQPPAWQRSKPFAVIDFLAAWSSNLQGASQGLLQVFCFGMAEPWPGWFSSIQGIGDHGGDVIQWHAPDLLSVFARAVHGRETPKHRHVRLVVEGFDLHETLSLSVASSSSCAYDKAKKASSLKVPTMRHSVGCDSDQDCCGMGCAFICTPSACKTL